jgi:hypothetical protein
LPISFTDTYSTYTCFHSRPPPPLHTPQLPRKGKPPPLFLRRRGELFPFPRAARVRGKMGGVRARGSPTIFLYNKKEKVGDLYRSWKKGKNSLMLFSKFKSLIWNSILNLGWTCPPALYLELFIIETVRPSVR